MCIRDSTYASSGKPLSSRKLVSRFFLYMKLDISGHRVRWKLNKRALVQFDIGSHVRFPPLISMWESIDAVAFQTKQAASFCKTAIVIFFNFIPDVIVLVMGYTWRNWSPVLRRNSLSPPPPYTQYFFPFTATRVYEQMSNCEFAKSFRWLRSRHPVSVLLSSTVCTQTK